MPSFLTSCFTSPPDGVSMVDDTGYNSAAEMEAVFDLARFNDTTGPRPGDSVTRVIKENGRTYVMGWVNPFFHDPVAVRFSATTMPEWCFTDDPDTAGEWRQDFEAYDIAAGVLGVLNRHRKALLGEGTDWAPGVA